MLNVTIFNEFYHEQKNEKAIAVYPEGIHNVLKGFIENDEISVKCFTLFDNEANETQVEELSDEVLSHTDVLIWWGHVAHNKVPDDLVERCYKHIIEGMGAIFLHSAHHSKLFKKLMGTTCNLKWRYPSKERLWNINPAHPIMQNVPEFFDIELEEMYGERFDIPTPKELLMISAFDGHEVFRSACTFQRGYGNIFYFQPGHETNPTFRIPEVQAIIKNAVYWAKPLYRNSFGAPKYEKVEL